MKKKIPSNYHKKPPQNHMPPRRIIPGEGAKYQNVVAYKADLHLKTSESSQKLLQQLKNQALQHICKRCREKIECASSKCFFVSFYARKHFPFSLFRDALFPSTTTTTTRKTMTTRKTDLSPPRREIQVREIQAQKKRECTEMSKLC